MAISKKKEQQWQAESDAHVMAQYQEIMRDKQRRDRAVKAAQQQARDLTDRASVMQRAASMGTSNKGTKKK